MAAITTPRTLFGPGSERVTPSDRERFFNAGRPPLRRAEPVPVAAAPVAGGRPTLDELLVGAWEGLHAGRVIACPVCAGAMAPRPVHGSGTAGGRCGDCGTVMS